ncbi:MAG: TonB-dependent receptor [Candidatus Thiodiazotropha endolucinida]
MSEQTLRKHLLSLLHGLLLLALSNASADNSSPSGRPTPGDAGNGIDPDLQRLLAIVDKYTEIATKTRLNADYVPGMVTVLDGDHLASSGKSNVWEALTEVPGIEPYVAAQGARTLTIRGTGFNFSSGNFKVLVNGIAQNTNLHGGVRPVMSLPVELVERIEVIRGPGSAVHGEYAYTGVINVITRKDDNRAFVRAGEDERYSGGATLAWADDGSDWRLNLNVFAEDMAVGDVISGPDGLTSSLTNTPGPVNDARDARVAILELGHHDFGLSAQHIVNRHGEQFGINNTLPAPDDRLQLQHVNTAVDLHQGFALNSGWDATLRLGWLRHKQDVDEAILTILPVLGTVQANTVYEERQRYGGLQLEGRIRQRHDLLIDLQYRKTDIREARSGGSFTGPVDFLLPERDRHHLSLALQDQFPLSDDATITAGLRYDDYNDVGNAFSPRLAAVWRLTNRHILKAQYAKAFRPPTFVELYTRPNQILRGNPNIENTDSTNHELGYIFKGADTTVRATLYYSELNDLITVVSGTYTNGGDARLRGLELEIEHAVSKALSMHANTSYTDTEDRDTGGDLTGAPDWLANLGVRYRLSPGVLLDAHYRYVGDRARGAGDPRAALEDYQIVDLAASFIDVEQSGMTLRAGIRNLFDEDYAYSAPPGTYPEDYPQRGRQWWLQGEFAF